MRFDLLILDNDGVLVDSEPIANRVLAGLLTECGHRTTYEESVRDYLGGTLRLVRDAVEPLLGRRLPDDFEDRYHERLFARMRTELTAVAGVTAALDALAAIDLPVCVASSGTHERIETALTTVGLLDRFAGRVFSAEDVARGKPYPDLFLYAAERMGADAERCLVVEDSPHGVTAAKAARMTVIGYVGLTPAARLAGADIVIDRMADLPEAVRLSVGRASA
ncbi:MAG TPA: HAD family phosphatase [Streptosporangiaceae bacterium]|nr:HAD family phosphatase [Streptosporangiaceae bacterium]